MRIRRYTASSSCAVFRRGQRLFPLLAKEKRLLYFKKVDGGGAESA